ncbi:polyprenyl synthetase family protein [Gemmatimonas sp.]|jgi:geranylgeranyl pyrophosphate synthase|uniref:polyprenyl synthetase family protein n=1 Tax=Gemmatimonas sp. TaxID=1962908 RepID=UPI0022C7319F|nr:polyprenyl synthetase family protein [Gemmatimonas sp.]MCA2984378.1 polyprenyl synthetase family protein [Gemmatimonas sp.]MCA2988156.1 polyprenyl synthetase family protein [Gemmatimonas sp.]MCA2990452.1 polyprenyl synthetase family protein [Gemmatimonas sp.]MCA2994081.1 polyprenyl synthetase family protein [Gemmatimonas sp.]MCE2954127.1 polyprenyl synthetase family protein [Gemmatimonas sp.]
MSEDTSRTFAAERIAVQRALDGFCARWLGDVAPLTAEAIRYALLGEGKRLRAVLLLEAYRACGGTGDALDLAASVEVVHAYSLVHDDLPCMDDDDVRRGRPTVHRVYGVPVATAAGLAMVPLAARCAWHAAKAMGLGDETAADIVRDLMGASGAGGMIGGQLLDLEGEGVQLTLESLERVHRLKTGALIMASVTLGARAALAPAGRRAALARYGAAIGLAFQIADDVLDITATTDQLGKTAARDLDLNKSTYPALLGVEGAIERAVALVEDGCAALQQEGLLTPTLEQLARYIVERRS